MEIGQIVQEWRGERSQQAIADEMRDRGHRWSQATVWSVEKGDRPLKLTEAADLADICEKHVVDLTRDLASARLREAWRESGIHLGLMENHLEAFLRAQDQVRMLLEEGEYGADLVEMAEAVLRVDLIKGVTTRMADQERSRERRSG